MTIAQQLTPEELKQLRLLDQQGTFLISPEQMNGIAAKAEDLVVTLQSSPSIPVSQRENGFDLAFTLGIIGFLKNNPRLTHAGDQLLDILNIRFPGFE